MPAVHTVEKAGAETSGVATVGSICSFEVFRVAVDAYYARGLAAPVATPVHTSALVNALANASVGAATLLTLWAIAPLQGASKRLLRNKGGWAQAARARTPPSGTAPSRCKSQFDVPPRRAAPNIKFCRL